MNDSNYTQGDRLRVSRINAGYTSAADACRRFGWTTSTFVSHENGTRAFTLPKAKIYGRAFKVNPYWLLDGHAGGGGTQSPPLVPVVGYVRAGGEQIAFDDHAHGEGLFEVEAPPGMTEKSVAVQVRGASMYPAYEEGDILFYSRNGEGTDIGRCIGKQCIVKQVDGPIYIKILANGSAPGLYTLMSYNHPPIRDVALEWAVRVKYVMKS